MRFRAKVAGLIVTLDQPLTIKAWYQRAKKWRQDISVRIVVLPGDGIGPEITAATLTVLRAASEQYALNINLEEHPVGHASL